MADSKLTFDNKITTGNVLTILGGIFAFVFMFADLREQLTKIDGRVTLAEQSIEHTNQRITDKSAEAERYYSQMNSSLQLINNKLDDIQKELGRKADRANQAKN